MSSLLLEKIRNALAERLVQCGKAFAGHAFKKELLHEPGKVNVHLAQIPLLAVPRGGSHVQSLLLSRANRHGLIAGATGTGKTVTLQILAEGFSAQGVPVFMADVKGDLSGISQPGTPKPALLKRAEKIGLEPYTFHGFPTVFWDVFGVEDHPMRATISDMGPLLLSRLLELNDTQEGVLNIAFKVADEHGMALLAADQLIQRPRLYATILLWLLAELFEDLPEVGDPDKPKLVFFFDESPNWVSAKPWYPHWTPRACHR